MQLVDLIRYPLDRPESAEYESLVRQCRERFAADGLLTLPGFLLASTIADIAAEANGLVDHAFFCHNTHNPYLDAGSAEFSPDHVRNQQQHTDVGSIANDLLQPAGALQRLYEWQPLTDFIGAVLGYHDFYRGADPLGAVSVNVYGEGDGHGWHFDESRFSVTIMIQDPERGGHFEYVTGLRSDQGDDFAALELVLSGDLERVERLEFEPGTLSIFGGRNTLHRVTPIEGERRRLVPVLTYDTVPGSVNSESVRELFWGRTAAGATS